jgi:MFS family permease
VQALSQKNQQVKISAAVMAGTPGGLLRIFAALRHRNFRLFWFGQLISLIGTWMQMTAQAWLVLELTHSAWLLGLVGALQYLPVMLFSLFGGVLADRLPKRTVLLFTQSSAAIQAALLWILVVTGTVQLWHLLLLAVLLGVTNSLDMPTRQAFVFEMVGREELLNAIALNSSLFSTARIVGPGMAGLLIVQFGLAPLFMLNAISFLPVILGIALIDSNTLLTQVKQATTAPHKPTTLQKLREGLTYVIHTPEILLIITVVGAVSLFGINFNVVLPLFATDVLHSGAAGFGFLSSAIGLGALLSALYLAWSNKRPSMTHMLLAALIFSVLEALFALSHWYMLSLLLIAAVGFAQVVFTTIANTTLQTVTPDYLRGRIMSVYMLVFVGSNPVGNLFTGGLAHLFGSSISLLVGAGLSLTAAIVGSALRAPAEKSIAVYTKRELAHLSVNCCQPAAAHRPE